jgi:four helix bundle protein
MEIARDDFAYKMSLALKEARESRFWLRRMYNNRLIKPARLAPLIQESEEIVAILITIVAKSRANSTLRKR